ncbi:MAG: CaiB/BaiF CoA transferase family protein, partial [Candidatus Binatia bacterium]
MGPLAGIKIVELAGIGPGPFCSMLLADLGAEVVRVDRIDRAGRRNPNTDVLLRGRRSIAVDLKQPDGVATVLRLVEQADALLEGFRPGVTERLGLGPDDCWRRNPRLVYGRMTGWGQEGSLAQAAGHDVNYIALAGALRSFARRGERPLPPLNTVGDFGGGGMFLAVGVLAALLEAKSSGKGQVVDAAMVDGAAYLVTMFYEWLAWGIWKEEPGTNMLDTGSHFYDVYETSDGKYVSIGSIEPQFYADLVRLSGLEKEDLPGQFDRAEWPAMKERLTALFRTKTRDEWCRIMEGSDVCFAPVLSLREAPAHPHNVARKAFVEVDGAVQPAPAPRFSRTPAAVPRPPAVPGEHTDEVLGEWGFSA